MDFDVLKFCKKPQIITHIMYKANVNCTILKMMLNRLISLGLMKRSKMKLKPKKGQKRPSYGKRDSFETTKKGAEFLRQIKLARVVLKL